MSEEQHTRRIDIVLKDDFVDDIGAVDTAVLREKRMMADEVETELSFYRRMLHGRMDLLAFEIRRRTGEETRSLIEALPEILGAGERTGPMGRVPAMFSPDLPSDGKRPIDRVLADDFLTRMPELSDSELDDIQQMLTQAEEDISIQRKSVQMAFDGIQKEITKRYKNATADSPLSD